MDPYIVLGINQNASDDEIKSVYRKLSRKYHPDANMTNPYQEEFEEKFKEVQQAYKMILRQRQENPLQQNEKAEAHSGNEKSNVAQNRFTDLQDEKHLHTALNYIQNGYYNEGLSELEEITTRRGPWFYYYAFANYKKDNLHTSLETAKVACALEPDNFHYARLLNQIKDEIKKREEVPEEPDSKISAKLKYTIICGVSLLVIAIGVGVYLLLK